MHMTHNHRSSNLFPNLLGCRLAALSHGFWAALMRGLSLSTRCLAAKCLLFLGLVDARQCKRVQDTKTSIKPVLNKKTKQKKNPTSLLLPCCRFLALVPCPFLALHCLHCPCSFASLAGPVLSAPAVCFASSGLLTLRSHDLPPFVISPCFPP